MPTRTGVLIPIVAAAVIIGVAGMLTLPTDVKLESVEFPRGTIIIDDKILEVQIADTKEKIIEVAAGIRNREFEPQTGRHCDWCDYKSLVCHAWEE